MFVLLTSQLTYGSSTAGGVGYDALDLRVGAAVGTTLWKVLAPYEVGRAFGGPVYWRYQGASIVGTDDHHGFAYIEQPMKQVLLADHLRSFPSTVAGARPLVRPRPRRQQHVAAGKGTARIVEDAQPRDSSPGRPVEREQRFAPFAVDPAIPASTRARTPCATRCSSRALKMFFEMSRFASKSAKRRRSRSSCG
jgi:hypothetical protein